MRALLTLFIIKPLLIPPVSKKANHNPFSSYLLIDGHNPSTSPNKQYFPLTTLQPTLEPDLFDSSSKPEDQWPEHHLTTSDSFTRK